MSTTQPNRTRLDAFIERHKIDPQALARESGLSAEAIENLRHDDGDPTLADMRQLLRACRGIAGVTVEMTELFDLGDE
jgi:transcriptional regulator with XRE-family HTH domain